MPQKNIGTNDRLFRLSLAVLILGYAVIQWSWLALIVGLFVLYEALVGWCAFYQIVGKNSCPIDKR